VREVIITKRLTASVEEGSIAFGSDDALQKGWQTEVAFANLWDLPCRVATSALIIG
jgi:hypothetical protein